jgi:hypothetical protein
MYTPEFVIPIRAQHIRKALGTAREDQDAFRKAERTWLEANHPLLALHFSLVFEHVIKNRGIEAADAMLAGCVLGSRAVRLCVEAEGMDYQVAIDTTLRNLSEEAQYADQFDSSWDTAPKLNQVFGNTELTTALMDIKHDNARDGAAVTIGNMCLKSLPPPSLLQPTS